MGGSSIVCFYMLKRGSAQNICALNYIDVIVRCSVQIFHFIVYYQTTGNRLRSVFGFSYFLLSDPSNPCCENVVSFDFDYDTRKGY